MLSKVEKEIMSTAKRIPRSDGMFGVMIEPQTLMETDSLRGDIPRSKWVERALVMYNASVKPREGKNDKDGVRGSQATNQSSAPTTPTLTTSTEARKTNMPLYNGGFGA
jgi:hypothetical protein